MTVLPGQSQENLPNPPSVHIYKAGGLVAGISFLSRSQMWANRRRCQASTQQIRMEKTFHPYDDETGSHM